MCTVSFIPRPTGFYLAMNRDEKRTRLTALPPAIVALGRRRAIFPHEPNGGTWIAINDAGVCLALINWHRIEREPARSVLSRGQVIRKLIGKSSSKEIATALAALPLKKLRPFRLIVISSLEKKITQWRWNLQRLSVRKHAWRLQHWFSSGFDERTVERVRAKICASFVAGGDDPGKGETSPRIKRAGVNAAGYSLNVLRRVHRSHAPRRGPFSICMHRADAATVSYTEITVQDGQTEMRYKAGSPCSNAEAVTKTL